MKQNKFEEWCEFFDTEKESAILKLILEMNLQAARDGTRHHLSIIPLEDSLMVTCSDQNHLTRFKEKVNDA